jgi:hypothetical protein
VWLGVLSPVGDPILQGLTLLSDQIQNLQNSPHKTPQTKT